jgi:hypothetical protein
MNLAVPRFSRPVPRFSRLCATAFALFVVSILSFNPCVASHPFHVSSAEVNWNSKSGNFEVALCVWPADLEKAIARQQTKAIDLDKVDELDELMKQYVASRFSVRQTIDSTAQPAREATADDKSADIRWVGHEMDLQKAWLYFEIPGDQQTGQWEIQNRVFFELNEDQVNHMKLTGSSKPESFSHCKAKARTGFATKLPAKKTANQRLR